jgi:uncharacterized protein
MAINAGEMRIQICYARPDLQILRELTVAEGTTLGDAIRLSGIAREFTDIDLTSCRVGIYGKIKSLEAHLREGDRIEIYRPLRADPKDARRRRAQKKSKG